MSQVMLHLDHSQEQILYSIQQLDSSRGTWSREAIEVEDLAQLSALQYREEEEECLTSQLHPGRSKNLKDRKQHKSLLSICKGTLVSANKEPLTALHSTHQQPLFQQGQGVCLRDITWLMFHQFWAASLQSSSIGDQVSNK